MKEYARVTNEMLRKKGKPPIADESDWQFHTDEMLIRKLFYWKEDTIRKAIIYLEREKGFIDTNAPTFLKNLYKSGRTKWFRILVPNVQEWIRSNYPLDDIETEEIVTLAPMERRYEKAALFTATAKRIFTFRQKFHNEEKENPAKSELQKITARLKDGFDEIDMAFAIIGNAENPWHKGVNPNSTEDRMITYHLIRHIFKDKDQVKFFKTIAEGNGWTRSTMINKYEELLNINYGDKTSIEIKEATQTETDKLEQNRIYRETASLLTELVISKQMKMDDILIQFFNHSDKLKFTITDLSDPIRLGNEIVDCLSQSEIVANERKTKIMQFAETFIYRLRGGE